MKIILPSVGITPFGSAKKIIRNQVCENPNNADNLYQAGGITVKLNSAEMPYFMHSRGVFDIVVATPHISTM
jgi:hypothetical protein